MKAIKIQHRVILTFWNLLRRWKSLINGRSRNIRNVRVKNMSRGQSFICLSQYGGYPAVGIRSRRKIHGFFCLLKSFAAPHKTRCLLHCRFSWFLQCCHPLVFMYRLIVANYEVWKSSVQKCSRVFYNAVFLKWKAWKQRNINVEKILTLRLYGISCFPTKLHV